MSYRIRESLFIASAFLLGSCQVLYNVEVYIFLVITFLINVRSDFHSFIANVKQEWKYLLLPLIAISYLVIHYLFSLFIKDIPYEVSWNRVELLLLYFFFIPLYVISAKSFISVRLLKKTLLWLCWGILVFNFTKLFYLTGFSLFTDTSQALNMLYESRFGCHLDFLGGFVYLEPQTVYLSVVAIIAYFFILQSLLWKDWKLTVNSGVILVLSLLFLSFTVTKGAILSFLCGFLLLSIFYFRKFSYKNQALIGIIVLVLATGAYFALPDVFSKRFKEVGTELEHVSNGKLSGGSIAPRVKLLKESFSHFDEFGLVGLGVYKNSATDEWYANSKYTAINTLNNVHNSFVEFWLIGGIPGLLFILYYFLAPVGRMLKKKKYSFLVLAIIFALIMANNTCVLMIFVDSGPFILFMLAISFFYLEQFLRLQENKQ